MGRHALSQAKRHARLNTEHTMHFRKVLDLVNEAHDSASMYDKKPTVKKIVKEYNEANHTSISLHSIFQHLHDPDTCTQAEAAAKRQLLDATEEQTLLATVHLQAKRGFPLTAKGVKCHALEIACICTPTIQHMGPSWIHHFAARHHFTLKTTKSKKLDRSRAASANPAYIEHNFKLFKVLWDKYQFKPKNVYGMDESGFPFGGDESGNVVYCDVEATIQHQQTEGNRENVTAIVTICADGTTVTPTVIFKGKNMNSAWHDANLLLEMK